LRCCRPFRGSEWTNCLARSDPLPRYFFHLRDGTEHIDRDGVELQEDRVRGAAVTAAGEAIKDLGEGFFEHPGWKFWVTDEAGKTVCTLRLTRD
jgi:hypothetical protein